MIFYSIYKILCYSKQITHNLGFLTHLFGKLLNIYCFLCYLFSCVLLDFIVLPEFSFDQPSHDWKRDQQACGSTILNFRVQMTILLNVEINFNLVDSSLDLNQCKNTLFMTRFSFLATTVNFEIIFISCFLTYTIVPTLL